MATARIDVDHPAVARWATRGLAVLALTAFAVGAPSLVEVGAWAGLGWSAWGLPLVVDLGLVIGAVSATVARQRQSRAGLLWFGTVALVMLSTVAQGVHAWTRAEVDGPARWVAIALGALPPLAVLWSTEALIRLIVSEPVGHQARRKSARSVDAGRSASADRGPIDGGGPGAVRGPRAVPGPESGPDAAPAPKAVGQSEVPSPAARAMIVAQAQELLAEDDSISMRAVSKSVGVSRTTLARWLKEAAEAEAVGQPDSEDPAA